MYNDLDKLASLILQRNTTLEDVVKGYLEDTICVNGRYLKVKFLGTKLGLQNIDVLEYITNLSKKIEEKLNSKSESRDIIIKEWVKFPPGTYVNHLGLCIEAEYKPTSALIDGKPYKLNFPLEPIPIIIACQFQYIEKTGE